MQQSYNPRFVVWARSIGKRPEDFDRAPGDGIARVVDTLDPQRRKLPWTIVFSIWIRTMWREWATSLGFRATQGHAAHEVAMLNGHTADEFDAWLEARHARPLS